MHENGMNITIGESSVSISVIIGIFSAPRLAKHAQENMSVKLSFFKWFLRSSMIDYAVLKII